MKTQQIWMALSFAALLSTVTFADRVLDRDGAEKIEIRHSMLGYRDTLAFYLFAEQQAVLVLSIGNQDETSKREVPTSRYCGFVVPETPFS